MENENIYYQKIIENQKNKEIEKGLKNEIRNIVSKESNTFRKMYFDNFYNNIEKGYSSRFDESLDYMNCILEETKKEHNKKFPRRNLIQILKENEMKRDCDFYNWNDNQKYSSFPREYGARCEFHNQFFKRTRENKIEPSCYKCENYIKRED